MKFNMEIEYFNNKKFNGELNPKLSRLIIELECNTPSELKNCITKLEKIQTEWEKERGY